MRDSTAKFAFIVTAILLGVTGALYLITSSVIVQADSRILNTPSDTLVIDGVVPTDAAGYDLNVDELTVYVEDHSPDNGLNHADPDYQQYLRENGLAQRVDC